MKVEIDIDEKYVEEKVIIQAPKMSADINSIIQKVSGNNEIFKVYLGDETFFIKEDDIESIYTEEGKIIVQTKDNKYISKNRIYEFENILSKDSFLRISNSEIVNFDKVKSINTKMFSTVSINFNSGYQTYASRRYINKIKEFLKL